MPIWQGQRWGQWKSYQIIFFPHHGFYFFSWYTQSDAIFRSLFRTHSLFFYYFIFQLMMAINCPIDIIICVRAGSCLWCDNIQTPCRYFESERESDWELCKTKKNERLWLIRVIVMNIKWLVSFYFDEVLSEEDF